MIISAIGDFFWGLGRGLNLFITHRHGFVEQAIKPDVKVMAKK